MKRFVIFLILSVPLLASGAGFDVNSVTLGDSELAIKKSFPGIRCKPLEWKTAAADRRCDDAKVPFAGIESRVTFYLKSDSVQGFDVRFEMGNVDLVANYLRGRYGKPLSESREKIIRKNKEEREVFKILWEQGRDSARLSALSTGKRGSLSVSRGNFAEEIYHIK